MGCGNWFSDASLLKFSEGAMSIIHRHSTGGINASAGKRIDAGAIPPIPPRRSTVRGHINSGLNRRRRSETPRRCVNAFCADAFFLSRLHRIAISPELAAMDSAAGTAAVLARARRGRRGHLSGRQSRGTAGDISACVFFYNDFSNSTSLLFFVKIATAPW